MKKKILLFHYFGGAGAKFIANCLSFSNKVVFANYHISQQLLINNDFNFLEKQILNTIPAKINHREWHKFEQGCTQLFGNGINLIKNGKMLNNLNNLNDLSIFKEAWLPLMTHSIVSFNNCKDYFSKDTVFTILVDGTPKFIDIAIRLKWKQEYHCIDLDMFNDWQNNCKSLNFDFRFDDWNPLDIENHIQISELAEQINCPFDLSLANNYIKKYIDFHIT